MQCQSVWPSCYPAVQCVCAILCNNFTFRIGFKILYSPIITIWWFCPKLKSNYKTIYHHKTTAIVFFENIRGNSLAFKSSIHGMILKDMIFWIHVLHSVESIKLDVFWKTRPVLFSPHVVQVIIAVLKTKSSMVTFLFFTFSQ